jgi:hypothetical protein
MGLYNFQARFVTPVLLRTKNHTIRAKRKYPDKPGDTLHLYTGLRTKKAILLMRARCVKVEEILLDFLLEGWPGKPKYIVKIDGIELSWDEREQLARADGFSDFHEMMNFWREPKNRLPFRGDIIHWK